MNGILQLSGQFKAGSIEISITCDNKLILEPGIKEVALFLSNVALKQDPFDASLSIASIFYFFSSDAKSSLSWSDQNIPDNFLELQFEFNRLMNLAPFI